MPCFLADVSNGVSNAAGIFWGVSRTRTRTPAVYVRHQAGCPARGGSRCRCSPSYRARRRDVGWSPTFGSREQAAEWKSSAAQDNELTLSRNAVIAAETRAVLDRNHDWMLKQMAQEAAGKQPGDAVATTKRKASAAAQTLRPSGRR
jgi:hypothetical protein